MVEILAIIKNAFSERVQPRQVVNGPGKVHDDEYQQVFSYEGKRWEDLACNHLEQYPEAFWFFLPEAFCYFLPGVLSAEIAENRPDLWVNVPIISDLSRHSSKELWDSRFIERWASLNIKECEALQYWILWLTGFELSITVDEDDFVKAFDALNLLINEKGGVSSVVWN